MKRFLLLAVNAGLLSPIAAKPDLGGADLPSSQNVTSGKIYKAWCGVIPKKQKVKDRKDCSVQFKDDRLVVDEGKGISKDQLISVK